MKDCGVAKSEFNAWKKGEGEPTPEQRAAIQALTGWG